MSEYISKEDISRVLLARIGANKSCLSNARKLGNHEGEQYFQKLVFEDEQIASLIEELPSGDVRPITHARWEKVVTVRDENGEPIAWHFKCSHCFNTDSRWGEYSFCPKCGCKMDREPKGEKGDT